jgi:PAS domain S-box-containing protein
VSTLASTTGDLGSDESTSRRGAFGRLASAITLSVLALALAWVLWPAMSTYTVLPSMAAVLVSAWASGLAGGLVATVVSVIGMAWLFAEPRYSLPFPPTFTDAIRLTFFTLVSVGASYASQALRSAKERAEREAQAAARLAERLRAQTVELEAANSQLRHQATEMEHQTEQAQALAGELEETTQALTEREARLAGIIGSATDAIVSADAGHRIIVFNRAAEQMFGVPAEQALGTPLQRFLPERYRASHSARMDAFGRGGTSSRSMHGLSALPALRADGTEFLVEATISVVTAEGERIYTAVLRDVTERVRADAALRASEERYRLLVDGVRDYAIFGLDVDGRVASWNAGAERIKGYRADEIVGQHFSRFYPADDVAQEKPARELVIAAEVGRFEEEGWRLRKDGTRFWANVVITAMRDDEGRLVGYSKVTRDVTERRRAEQALRAANAELAATTYTIAHDLRSPLRALDGYSRMLQLDYASCLGEEGAQHLDRIRANSQRMGRLIDGVLTLARLGRGDLQRERVDLSAIACAVIEDLRRAEPERFVDVRVEPGLVAEGDSRLITMLLQNLLGNAWKFTRNRRDARIELAATECDGERVYVARDNGAGFNPEFSGKLFGAFQRLHQEAEFEGHGIGLATVKRIVERHGGRVWGEGALDRGATFSFTLAPAAQDPPCLPGGPAPPAVDRAAG